MNVYGLNVRERRFLDLYFKSGNQSQSYIEAGYSEKGASSGPGRILRKERSQLYLQDLASQIDAPDIANPDEVLSFLTTTMRGRMTIVTDDGSEIYDSVDINGRLRAAEMLGKRYGIFVEKKQSENISDISITIDYGDDKE